MDEIIGAAGFTGWALIRAEADEADVQDPLFTVNVYDLD